MDEIVFVGLLVSLVGLVLHCLCQSEINSLLLTLSVAKYDLEEQQKIFQRVRHIYFCYGLLPFIIVCAACIGVVYYF